MIIFEVLIAIKDGLWVHSKFLTHVLNELINVHISNLLLLAIHLIVSYGLKVVIKVLPIIFLDLSHWCELVLLPTLHGGHIRLGYEDTNLFFQMLLELFTNIVVVFKFCYISFFAQHFLDSILDFWEFTYLIDVHSVFWVHSKHCLDKIPCVVVETLV